MVFLVIVGLGYKFDVFTHSYKLPDNYSYVFSQHPCPMLQRHSIKNAIFRVANFGAYTDPFFLIHAVKSRTLMKRSCRTILNKAQSWRDVVFWGAPVDLSGTKVPVVECLWRMWHSITHGAPEADQLAYTPSCVIVQCTNLSTVMTKRLHVTNIKLLRDAMCHHRN